MDDHRGATCGRCHQRIYLVQSVSGERFYVATYSGQRWCR